MTDAEIITAKARLVALFPSVKHWAGQLDGLNEVGLPVPRRPGDIREAIATRWALALREVELADAIKAIEALAVEANDPWPYHADKERIGAIIAAKARGYASERAEHRRTTSEPIKRRNVANAGLGIMARLEAAVEAHPGHSEQCREFRQLRGRCHPACKVTERLAREIAAEDVGLEPDGAIYDCPHCRDTGQVEVMYPADVLAVAAGADPAQFTRATTARCTCRLGENRERAMRPDERWGKFDPELHVNARRSRQQIRLDCSAIAETYKRMTDKRVSSFDEFNDAA